MNPEHPEAVAVAAASSMTKGDKMTRHYPRIRVRLNSSGKFDAYLIKASWSAEIWLSTGPTIAGALWWVPAPIREITLTITNERS